jgi:hypothetical protein
VKKNNNKKLIQLTSDLKSNISEKISKALMELAKEGDASVIPDLIQLLILTNDRLIQNQIKQLLSDINDQNSAEVLMSELKKIEKDENLKQILPIFWESKLNLSEYLADFVEIGVDNDYLIALDCLTIIENMAGPFSESQLLEAQLHLKEYVENKSNSDERKSQILSEIAIFIKDQNEGIDADLLFD